MKTLHIISLASVGLMLVANSANASLVEPTPATKLTHLLPDNTTETGPTETPACKRTTTARFRCQTSTEEFTCRAAMAQGEPGAADPYGDQYNSVTETNGTATNYTATTTYNMSVGASFNGGVVVNATAGKNGTWTITYVKCVW
jgi:hypothetical protein